MRSAVSPATRTLGYASALCAFVFSVAYVIGQLAEWIGWLGSAGGPESSSTPLGLIVLLTPSLFLGSSFLLMMVCIHQLAAQEKRVWTQAALVFATAYTVLISINYFVQLTWVTPRLMAGRTEGIEHFLFVPFDSFLYSVDILGYSFMSVATLLAASAFSGPRMERLAKWFLVANGLLLPFIALQMYWHAFIWVASLWAVTFPGACIAIAIIFRRTSTAARAPSAAAFA